MAVPTFGSVLIGSSQVDTMKEWYRACFPDAKENQMGAFEFGGAALFVEEHSEVSGPAKEPARMIINLSVDDCRAIESHLRSQNVNWIREVEQTPHALIGTVSDPDGNYVQVIQWGAAPTEGHTS
ncbi:MAG TPA: VOC family protein [Ilumatobacter sp.]|nr:VOC family protein [Ilumatobacter sp.]